MSILKVSYQHSNDDDFGRLRLIVETPDFAGSGGFWVQWQDVEEFAETLKTYPLSADAPPAAKWGFNTCEGDDLIIELEVKPIDRRGTLRVSVEIADDFEPKRRLRTIFNTHYPQMEEFHDALVRVMRREAEEAVLTGE